jgi:NAD(P) transhydrogenase subunit beta
MSTPALAAIYLVAALCFILALKGLSDPRYARVGNLVGAFGMLIAVAAVFFSPGLEHIGPILAAVAVGTVIGIPAARGVTMTAIPQMVALFNGVGGGAAAMVAIIEFLEAGRHATLGSQAATVCTVLIGSVSFSGSMLTYAKLQELMTTRPVTFPGGRHVSSLVALLCLGQAVGVLVEPSAGLLLGLTVAGLVLGVLFCRSVARTYRS